MSGQRTESPTFYRRTTTPLNPEISRATIAARVVTIGVVIAALALAWNETGRPTMKESIFSTADFIGIDVDGCQDLCGEPIGMGLEVYRTTSYEDTDFGLLREAPIQGDNVVAYLEPGHDIQVEAYYGTVYNSAGADSNGLGKIYGPDGDTYGRWFKVKMAQVIVLDDDGGSHYEWRSGLFVSGNFLTKEGVGEAVTLSSE